MKKFTWIFASLSIVAWMLTQPAGRLVRAEDLGSAVRVLAVPTGPWFSVDGQNYYAPMSAIWPAGSKHILAVDSAVAAPGNKSRYTFSNWTNTSGVVPGGNRVTVTADPNITEYHANFSME